MRYLTFLLPVMLFITACGGGSANKKQNSSQADTQTETQATANKSDDVRTIDIIGIDKMKYVVKEEGEMIGTAGKIKSGGENYIELESIDVKPGEKIRIRLKSKSKLPANAMSHNFVLLKRSAEPEAFDKAAKKAKDNDYIPSDMSDQIIAHTGLAEGGETVEVTFTAPEKTGENTYLCSFPAHFAAGMTGTLNVK